ncbi:MAG: hypothetical protein BAA02_07350 [Paenibacillaceae bacterium ZCTH02-B3]|nr:MAG: hypothetical protein BAA02_07350 [Paenibacillaceae bacterium ZCTH02-B3]
MAHLEVKGLTFAYAGSAEPALRNVTFEVRPGELAVLCGATGSGKTTLLRLIKRELAPGGVLNGDILLDGVPIRNWNPRQAAAAVGLVMQDPENQLATDTVEHELAFGMENFGFPRGEMRRRLAELAGFFGLEPLLEKPLEELSGGRKQAVNLAAVLLCRPRLLLMDEPLAQLDPQAARELIGLIRRLNEERGVTVLMSEHRLDELLPAADRVILLEAGGVAFNGPPADFIRAVWRSGDPGRLMFLPAATAWALRRFGDEALADPPLDVKAVRRICLTEGVAGSRMYPAEGLTGPAPGEMREGNSGSPRHGAERRAEEGNGRRRKEPLLSAQGVFFAYSRGEPAVIRGLDWTLGRGEFVALLGANGSGKSTLLQLLAGLRRPQRGDVRLAGVPVHRLPAGTRTARIGYLAQNPLLHFVHETVREELIHAAAFTGAADPEEEALRLARRFDLEHLLERHPHDLSGGERQRAALAIAVAGRPDVLLLDEPTKGLDPFAKAKLADELRRLNGEGMTLVAATHDVEFAEAHASRCALLFRGEIAADEPAETFFRGNFFYVSPLRRLADGRGEESRGSGSDGGFGDGPDGGTTSGTGDETESGTVGRQNGGSDNGTAAGRAVGADAASADSRPKAGAGAAGAVRAGWRNVLALFRRMPAHLWMIPAAVAYAALGVMAFRRGASLLAGFAMVFLALVPFYARYERKMRGARELALVAVLAALASVGRVPFALLLPSFTPVTFIVMVTGVVFGAEAGFIAGSMSALVSNFFLGQGPWTPWQMFAWGMAGYTAGLLARGGLFWRKRAPLAALGLVWGFLYGWILNASIAIDQWAQTKSWANVLAVYAAGLPFDAIHAAANVFFLALFGPAWIRLLERYRDKYSVPVDDGTLAARNL